MTTGKKWSPLDNGTRVRTTQPDESKRQEYYPEAWASRRWGVEGVIVDHHGSHGLCYDVEYDDFFVATHEPTEIEVIATT